MAQTVTNPYEIILNSVAYKIEGQIRPQLKSRFPARISTGDDSFDNEQYLSNWIISDQRGGIGVEEMDESVHSDRCFWTNCLIDYNNHIRLPRLATALTLPTMPTITDGGMEVWDDANTLHSWTKSVNPTLDQESGAANVYAGTYSAKLSGAAGYIYQDISSVAVVLGKRYSFTAYCKTSTASHARVSLWYDGTGGTVTYSQAHSGGGSFEKLAVSAVIPADATYVRVCCNIGGAPIAYFDTAAVPTLTSTNRGFCNFNSNTYMWTGDTILKVNTSTGAAMTFVGSLGRDITDMVASVNSRMYIAVADDIGGSGTLTNNTGTATGSPITMATGINAITVTGAGTFDIVLQAGHAGIAYNGSAVVANGAVASPAPLTGSPTVTVTGTGTIYVLLGTAYYYMNTSETFTQSTALADYFLQWDDKLNSFCTSLGASYYSTNPDAAAPTWTHYGTVTDIPAAKLRKPLIYQDADGNDIIYWANSIILKAHDAANTKYVDTKCKLSDHPNGAKGCLFWRDGLFLSEGLGIKKYTVGSSATITDVGLNKDDGLISYYNGEIVKLVEGENEMFALVDASQVTGTNYSGLYAYDGNAWSCWWADGTADEAMYDAIVSTAYGYRLYWIVGSTPTVYYIDLMRGSKNPSQLSGTISYASAGVWISPWFDAGSTNAAKCIKQIASYCKNITATETVTIKYRTNHTNTDIATGWTTLVTLDTSGENGSIETLLASGVGISVDAIQLRLDLARGSTTTNSPDVQAIVVSYLKTLDMKWGWNFTIVADEVYRGQSPAALISALQTAANSTTLVPFIFRDDATNYTKYVRIESFYGLHGTGHEYIGKYVVSVIEP